MTKPIVRACGLSVAVGLALMWGQGFAASGPIANQPVMFCGDGSDTVIGSLALQYTPNGWTLAEVEDAAAACTAKATAAGLKVLFPTTNGSDVLLESAPTFYLAASTSPVLPPRRFEFRFTEPVLCESYYPTSSPDLLALQLIDPNGRTQVLRGISAVDYALPQVGVPNAGRFAPTVQAGPQVQCHPVAYATLPANAPDIPVSVGGAIGGEIFSSGFETAAASGRADLRIEILDATQAYLRRNFTETIGNPFQYSIRVRNAGTADATGVRVREFVADTGATASLLTPKVEAGAWTCTARTAAQAQTDPGTACGNGTGVLTVDGAGFTLPAGASRTYTLTRKVPTANANERTVLAAAVFFDPSVAQGDVNVEDNVASAVIKVVENDLPVISCLGGPVGSASPVALASPLAMQEDGIAHAYNCTVTDNDGVASFSVTSSNPALLPTASLLGTNSGNVWPLTIAPAADKSGTSVLTFTATDTRGASRTMQVTVNVAEVNDPPIVDILHGELQLSPAGSLPYAADGVTQVPATRTGCLVGSAGAGECQVLIRDFFAVSPGVGEDSQTLTGLSVLCAKEGTSPIPELVFLQQPEIVPDNDIPPVPGAFDLRFTYDKALPATTAIRCSFKFRDSGSPAADSLPAEVLFTRFAGS